MILTQTPYRVSLFGGGTDYPEWFLQHGGAVLGMAIDKYCYVGVKHMPPGQLMEGGVPIRYRVQYSKVDDCTDIGDVKHPVVRQALRYYKVDIPLEFHLFGDLPGRSGLGGSSACTVGVLHALQRLLGLPEPEPLGLAGESIAFERHGIQEAVGLQDQIFSALGGFRFITFSENGVVGVQSIKVSEDTLDRLTSSMVLVYSGTMRDAHVMAAKQIDNVDRNLAVLREMTGMAFVLRGYLESTRCDLHEVGRSLHYSWQLKKQLHPEISNTGIDALYERGTKHGAWGGKLLGAGNGGFMLFFVEPGSTERFVTALGPSISCIPFKVCKTGSRIIDLNRSEA